MQTRITPDEMRAAARQLMKRPAGRVAMERLAELVERGEIDLDLLDQRAFLALLGGAWMGQRDTLGKILRETLADGGGEGSEP